MSVAIFSRYFGCAIVAAVAAGCNGGSTPSVGASTQQVQSGAPPRYSASVYPQTRGLSWMNARAHHRDWLVYVADPNGIEIYQDMPSHHFPGAKYAQLIGQITRINGFAFGALTECLGASSPRSGSDLIYVIGGTTSTDAPQIFEFAWGGTQPLASAKPIGTARGCAVDPTTGNVAVAGDGIEIFSGGLQGSTSFYPDPDGAEDWPPAYDGKGNLFFESVAGISTTHIDELPAGQSTIEHLSGLTINYPEGVQYVGGNEIAFADESYGQGSTSTAAIIPGNVVGSSIQTVGSPRVLFEGDKQHFCPNGSNVVYIPYQWSLVESHSSQRAFILAGNNECSAQPSGGDDPLDVWDFSSGKYQTQYSPAYSSAFITGTSVPFLAKNY